MWTKEKCNNHWKEIFLIRHIRRKDFVRTLQTLSSKGGRAKAYYKNLGDWALKEKHA
jgi:hypothetical protein